ncbi:MAG: hypothetical protein MJ132_02370, partial [Clostridia bacterium]|nr:hypothetical protein [Clostridia bacterium]
CFKPYYISDLNNSAVDKSALVLHCEKCGTELKQLNKWRYRNRWFCAKFLCEHCEETFNGRVSFRQNFDDVVVKQRVTEIVPPKEEENQDDLQPVSAQLPE